LLCKLPVLFWPRTPSGASGANGQLRKCTKAIVAAAMSGCVSFKGAMRKRFKGAMRKRLLVSVASCSAHVHKWLSRAADPEDCDESGRLCASRRGIVCVCSALTTDARDWDCRRRHSYNTKSNKTRVIKTPGGR